MDPLLYAREHDLDRQLSRPRGDRIRRRDLLTGLLATTAASALQPVGPNKVYRLAHEHRQSTRRCAPAILRAQRKPKPLSARQLYRNLQGSALLKAAISCSTRVSTSRI